MASETFQSMYKKEFGWPYPKPQTAKPKQPPLATEQPHDLYMVRSVDGVCHCDMHLYDPQMNKYKELSRKEDILCEQLYTLNQQMCQLRNEILEHPCDNDDKKMKSLYQTDYVKRGKRLTEYEPLMAMVDAPGSVPIEDVQTSKDNGYRDPFRFRYTALQRPRCDPCPPVNYVTTPNTIEQWFTDYPERTTYQDTISKPGLANMKSQQQYKEPAPSSRRRFGEQCL